MNRADNKQGFTIIELMLAMAFVSALLVAIAMTVIQIGSIYNKGITFKDVNQTGRSIASELQRNIAESSVFSISGADSQFISQDWGGRLCLGQYSYIWNYGKYIQDDDSRVNAYIGEDSITPIRFAKVIDPNTSYCVANAGVYPSIKKADAVELLVVGQGVSQTTNQHDLALHSFTIFADPPQDLTTKQGLYTIEFLLGTNNREALESDYSSCKPPGAEGADPAYCSVNRFDIVARAGNTVE